METQMPEFDRSSAREAWEKFRTKGTATRQAARLLHVGLEEYLNVFTQKHLVQGSSGEACKLVLGTNGEGKTHLLYCIREVALQHGHPVAMVEAKSVGAAMSPFVFGQELLMRLETPGAANPGDEDENSLIRLFREAVDRKRGEILAEGLDPDDLLPEWVNGLRTKNLPPHGFAQALSDGLLATIRRDVDGELEAAGKMAFQNAKLSKDQQQIAGSNLLKSIIKIPRLLGFAALVLLIDEAELAIEKAGSAKRRTFLTFLRFVNDHMARADVDSAVILIACTDDFWPNQFADYTALKGRLSDPGYDRLDTRTSLSLKALVNKNKLWVRETFRGRDSDYLQLGEGLLRIASHVLDAVDVDIQMRNIRALSRVASGSEVTPWVKRPFVKAFTQLVQDQVDNGNQVEVSGEKARQMFDLIRTGLDLDEEE